MADFFGSLKKKVKNKFVSARRPPQVTWKHLWSSDESATALSKSVFGKLPTEVMLQIFKYLSVHDLGKVSLVCRSFKMIADQDDIWKLKANCKCQHCLFFLPIVY